MCSPQTLGEQGFLAAPGSLGVGGWGWPVGWVGICWGGFLHSWPRRQSRCSESCSVMSQWIVLVSG